jgi:hypothetical protein
VGADFRFQCSYRNTWIDFQEEGIFVGYAEVVKLNSGSLACNYGRIYWLSEEFPLFCSPVNPDKTTIYRIGKQ